MKDHVGISARSRKNYRFQHCWIAPKPVMEFIKSFFEGRVLNLCCGSTRWGHVNVDQYVHGVDCYGNKIVNADVLDDSFDLNEEFDTVVADPPYNWPYDKRAKFNRIVNKHLRKGGLFLLNAPWIPRYFGFELKEVFVIYKTSGLPANATLLSIAMKK